MRQILLAGLLAAMAAFAASTGAVSVSVKDSASGEPVAGAQISIIGPLKLATGMDAYGRCRIDKLPFGAYTITVSSADRAVTQERRIVLTDAQSEVQLDFLFPPANSIAGRVLDESGEPLAGVPVWLLRSEYRHGSLVFSTYSETKSGSRGEYLFSGQLQPGRAFYVLADRREEPAGPRSGVADEFKSRPAFRDRAYYPNSRSEAGALPIVVAEGEHRERVDVHVSRSSSYCAQGVVRAAGRPALVELSISLAEPAGTIGLWKLEPEGEGDFEGTFRICDLSPSTYRLSALAGAQTGATSFTIDNRDAQAIKLSLAGPQPIAVETAWVGDPPERKSSTVFNISMQEIDGGSRVNLYVPVPGQSSQKFNSGADYFIATSGLTKGQYVKDVTADGASILHDSLHVTGGVATTLRFLVATDGGFLDVLVANREGVPLPGTGIHIFACGETSAALLAEVRAAGVADGAGRYSSGTLPPGKYYVLATNSPVDNSPESIARLWEARSKASTVQIHAGVTTPVKVEPMSIH